MKKPPFTIRSLFLAVLTAGTLFSGVLFAQEAEPSAPKPEKPVQVKVQAPARVLAPHVFRKIDPVLDQIYIVNVFNLKDGSRKDLPYSWAKNQPFYNNVWYFDFEIKSLRTVVLPSAIMVNGEKKAVLKKYLYLMYRIKNPAQYYTVQGVQTVEGVDALKGRQEEVFGKAQEDADALKEAGAALGGELPGITKLGPIEAMPMSFEFTIDKNKTLEFTPLFELQMDDEQWLTDQQKIDEQQNTQAGGESAQTSRGKNRIVLRRRKLIDEYNPYVVRRIAEKERPAGKLYGSCDFIGKKIKPGEVVWGVAIWSDINYTADRFSIVINGLTNVRKYDREKGEYSYKKLKLNYWHPGDEDIFRFGLPGGLDFEWIFE